MKILYFAALRERMRMPEEIIPLPPAVTTIAGLIGFLSARDPQGAATFAHPSLVRAAVNQAFANPDTPLADTDEVAFFPPVTGG